MRPPAHIAILFALTSSGALADPGPKWTQGRSVCDVVSHQLVDAAAAPVERKRLDQAWDNALADAEALAGLRCFPEAAKSAAAFAAAFRQVQTGVMPGFEATSCAAPGAAGPERLLRVRASLARIHESETFFSGALDKYDAVNREITAANPVALAFDDCRAKAQRSWASARLSLNKLSCELSVSLEQLDSYREHAEVSGIVCSAPAPAVRADAFIPERAPAAVPPEANPPATSAYPAFTGVLVSPATAEQNPD